MGLNTALSSWLRGAQSSATAALRAAQGYGATLQQQTITAVSVAQRAALQPIRQALQPRPSSRSPAAHTTRTITPVDAVSRAVSSGVRAAEQAVQQIARAHAPIVQGVRRDVARAAQAAPGAVRSVPAAAQQAARQISAAHAPIVQGIQRDASRAVRSAPAAVRSAPVAVQEAAQQIARSHAPIAQGIRRDAGTVARSVQISPQAIQEAKRTPFNAPAWAVAGAGVNLVRDVAKHGVVLPGDTDARYKAHTAAYADYESLKKQYAGNFEGNTFVARNAQDMAAYNRLQTAANRVGTTGEAYETSAQRELLGVPAALRGAGEWLAARDRDISGAALRAVPQLAAVPEAAGRIQYVSGLMTPGGLGREAGGRVARNILGKTAEEIPTYGEYQREMTAGFAEGLVYAPATTALWTGVGLGIGGVSGLAARGAPAVSRALGTAGRVSGVSKVASRVGQATGISRVLAGPARAIAARGPDLVVKGLGVAYAADVGYRSIIDESGYIRPPLEQARALGRITATEAGPMMAGAAAVSRVAPAIRGAVARGQRTLSSARNRSAPPAQPRGGWYPANEQIMEGLRMRALSPSSTIKTVRGSSRYPKSGVEMVEVSPGKRIPKGEIDNYLRRFEVETPQWRKPIPEEYLAAEDIGEAYRFGGRGGGVALPGDPAPKAGWYPENWQIMEGLRMREMSSPVTTIRGGGSRYPKSGVEMVEVSPGKRIPKGDLDNYLRRFEVETPVWRRPIPEEYLAAEDIGEAYRFGSRAGEVALDRIPAEYRSHPRFSGEPQTFYAGLPPRSSSRQVNRQRFPVRPAPGSSSGRTPRIRPTTRTVPVEPSSGQTTPLMLGAWGDSSVGEVSQTALASRQEVLPVTDSLSVLGQRGASVLDLGIVLSPLSRSGLDLLGRQGVISVQDQEQGQRQRLLQVSGQVLDMLQIPRTRLRQGQRQKLRSRYARPRPPVAPRAKAKSRGRLRGKRDEEEVARLKRLREKWERDHWELGPAPGLEEMSRLTFGAPSMAYGGAPAPARASPGNPGSILSFGPPSMGAVGRGVDPKTPPRKKVAHAAKTKDTARKQTQTGRRTKNSKR